MLLDFHKERNNEEQRKKKTLKGKNTVHFKTNDLMQTSFHPWSFLHCNRNAPGAGRATGGVSQLGLTMLNTVQTASLSQIPSAMCVLVYRLGQKRCRGSGGQVRVTHEK